MNWDNVKSQEFAVRILKAHIEDNRLSSTYLMTGEKESGKEDLATAFAGALLCGKKKYFQPCDCSSCLRVASQNHPDLQRILQAGARSIKIEEVRELISWASLKPYEGQWKVFILEGADRLTIEASNALLKTLEEPPARTLFCLLVESKSQVFETIQSRSFEIRLRPLKIQGAESINLRMEEKNWEEYLEEFQTMPREELKLFFDSLMQYFRNLIEREARLHSRESGMIPSWLEALDIVYESKEALDANANQKLVLTRLAMQLRKTLPKRERIS